MVVVIMGGISTEREVSLQSGKAVFNSLKKQGIVATLFDYNGNNIDQLLAKKPNKVFIALHGKYGEDGELQQLFDKHNISYTGSGSQASANCINKVITKKILKNSNLPVIEDNIIKKGHKAIINFKPPYAIKPAIEGSSIGVSKVIDNNINKALELAFSYDDTAIIERWISGTEITVPILTINNKDKALLPIEINYQTEFYNYEAKYLTDTTSYNCPANVSNQTIKKLQNIALQAFKVMGCKTWARVDFLIDAVSKKIYILEINTVPGMTTHSLFPTSAQASGFSFDKLVSLIVNN